MKIGSVFLGNRREVTPIFVGSSGSDITRGIYAMQIDIKNGEILKKGHFKSPATPVSMVRNERFVYTCYKNHSGRNSDGGIAQYAAMEMQFGLAARIYNDGKTYIHSFMNNDRTYLYAVDYYNGEVVKIPVDKKKIVRVSQTIKHYGNGPVEKRQDSPHPCFIGQTPDSKRIFVCDLGIDAVVLYEVGEKGILTRDEENTIYLKPGNGPRKMIFSPDGKYAYVLNELSSTISIYSYNDCHFTFIEEIDTYDRDLYHGINYGGDIILNKEGNYLFVSNKGYDSIRMYEVNKDTGLLKELDNVDTDENPTALMLINGRFVLAACQKGGSLETFEIKPNESKGILFETHFSYMLPEPMCIVEGIDLSRRE